jgi:hypothetical protein
MKVTKVFITPHIPGIYGGYNLFRIAYYNMAFSLSWNTNDCF